MSGLNYYSNFDDTLFKKYENTDSTRLYADKCAIDQRNNDNNKKLKFMTTNYIDLLENKEKLNFFGYSVKDELFVPGDKMDTYSDLLNGKSGGELTQCNVKYGLGQLPMPTTPYRGQLHHGEIDTEYDLQQGFDQVRRNTCLPRESNYQNRVFNIFSESQGIDTPNAINCVESSVNGFALGRMGADTRFDRYKNRK